MVIEIDAETKAQVKETFAQLKDDVVLHLFVKDHDCLYCNDTSDLANLVADLSEKIRVETHKGELDSDAAKEMGVEYTPAIVLEGAKRYNVKFYGIPAGHEFGALIGTILDVSKGDTPLPADIVEDIASVDKPVKIMVFVTPQCPYCPQMTRLAHQAAIINPLISSQMIEALEFQDLSGKYEVFGVPKTVFNDKTSVEGLTPHEMFLEKLFEAVE
ncbi:MAG: glutaredoxin [Candidatus Thorarchaeota archaeon]|nr:MAG: glutaredoxin [Candidatus Thorarchaeota archaeon]